jgi:hypothetical protein
MQPNARTTVESGFMAQICSSKRFRACETDLSSGAHRGHNVATSKIHPWRLSLSRAIAFCPLDAQTSMEVMIRGLRGGGLRWQSHLYTDAKGFRPEGWNNPAKFVWEPWSRSVLFESMWGGGAILTTKSLLEVGE